MTAQMPIEPLPVKKSPVRYVKWGAGLILGSPTAHREAETAKAHRG